MSIPELYVVIDETALNYQQRQQKEGAIPGRRTVLKDYVYSTQIFYV